MRFTKKYIPKEKGLKRPIAHRVKTMKVKAVIFDLDGTITIFNLDYITLRSEVRGFLLRKGIPASILSVNESILEMLSKTELFLRNSGKSRRTINKMRSEALTIAERWELEAAKTTSLLPGVMETLKILRQIGVKIGLCTVNSEKSASFILKRFGIDKFFDVLVPRNKVRNVKPSTEHLEAVLKALKISPKEALLVGDAARDMECARGLKVMAVGLSTGVSTQRELMESGADFIVTSITDLPTLINEVKTATKARAIAERKRKTNLT